MTKTLERKHSRNEYDFYADLEHIKEAVADATQHAKGRATEFISQSAEDLKEKSTDLKEHVEIYITEKPFKSLGFALLAGVFLGFIMRK